MYLGITSRGERKGCVDERNPEGWEYQGKYLQAVRWLALITNKLFLRLMITSAVLLSSSHGNLSIQHT